MVRLSIKKEIETRISNNHTVYYKELNQIIEITAEITSIPEQLMKSTLNLL